MQEKLFYSSSGTSVMCLNYLLHKKVAYAKRAILIVCVLFLFSLQSLEAKENTSVENHKKAILLVAFGTSVPGANVAYLNIEEEVQKEFPY